MTSYFVDSDFFYCEFVQYMARVSKLHASGWQLQAWVSVNHMIYLDGDRLDHDVVLKIKPAAYDGTIALKDWWRRNIYAEVNSFLSKVDCGDVSTISYMYILP